MVRAQTPGQHRAHIKCKTATMHLWLMNCSAMSQRRLLTLTKHFCVSLWQLLLQYQGSYRSSESDQLHETHLHHTYCRSKFTLSVNDWTSKHDTRCASACSRKAQLNQQDSERRHALLRRGDQRAAEAAAAHAQRLDHAECVAESKPWLSLIALASRLQLLQVRMSKRPAISSWVTPLNVFMSYPCGLLLDLPLPLPSKTQPIKI